MQIVVVGDLHIEKEKHLSKNECWYTPVGYALDQVYRYSIKNKIKKIVLLGDIFETPFPQQNSISWLFNYLNKKQDVEWNLILGNHDHMNRSLNSMLVIDQFSMFLSSKHIKVYSEPRIEKYKNHNLYYCPHPYKSLPEDYRTKKPTICFGHFEIYGSKLDNGYKVDDVNKKLKVLKNHYWIMGHLHTRHRVGRCYYIGTPLQRSFMECENRTFSHVDLSNPLEPKFKHIKLRLYNTLKKIYIQTSKDLETLKKLHTGNNIYWIKVGEDHQVNLNKWIQSSEARVYKTVLETKEAVKVESSINPDKKLNIYSGLTEYLKEKHNLDKSDIIKIKDKCKMYLNT